MKFSGWGLLLLLFTFCGAAAAEKPLVVTTILPVRDFAAQIAGGTAECVSLLPASKSPHDYAFTPADIARLAKARAWFTIGLPLEAPLRSRIVAAHPRLAIIPGDAGIKRLPMSASCEHGHHADSPAEDAAEEHGTENSAAHRHSAAAGADPHLWLDPLRAVQICRNLCAGLIAVFPENKELYEKNTAALIEKLELLNRDLQTALAPLKGKKIIVYHPAFGYFCERYGITQMPIELDGKAPSAAWLGQVISTAKAENIKVIFVQPQFSAGSAQTAAAAIGGKAVEFDALPADYLSYLRTVAEKLRP